MKRGSKTRVVASQLWGQWIRTFLRILLKSFFRSLVCIQVPISFFDFFIHFLLCNSLFLSSLPDFLFFFFSCFLDSCSFFIFSSFVFSLYFSVFLAYSLVPTLRSSDCPLYFCFAPIIDEESRELSILSENSALSVSFSRICENVFTSPQV